MKLMLWLTTAAMAMEAAEAKPWHRTVTVVVEAGRTDCYFAPNIEEGQALEFYIQVYFFFYIYIFFKFMDFIEIYG